MLSFIHSFVLIVFLVKFSFRIFCCLVLFEMAAARVGGRRHCCVRFNLCQKDGRLLECSRLDFLRKFVNGVLGFSHVDVNCLITLPQGNGFDLSFNTVALLRAFWEKFEKVK